LDNLLIVPGNIGDGADASTVLYKLHPRSRLGAEVKLADIDTVLNNLNSLGQLYGVSVAILIRWRREGRESGRMRVRVHGDDG
jgi:hypothetical protein